MSRIIAVANAKGGVGKTTTTANLAAALAERGHKVLAVDLDPQASLSISLGFKPTPNGPSIGDALMSRAALTAVTLATGEHFDLAPASHSLRQTEHELETGKARVYNLQNALSPVRSQYAYILLDCPANAGILTGNALAAADQVVIPFPADFLSLQALVWFLGIVKEIQTVVNPRLQLAGLFLIMYDPRVRHSREMISEAQEKYGIQVPFFASTARQAVVVKQAARFGQTVLKFAPTSPTADSFRALAREILEGRHEWEDANTALREAWGAQMRQDRARAYAAFCEVTRVAPGLVEGWIGRAQNTDDWGEAARMYAEALVLDRDSADAREGLDACVNRKLASFGPADIPTLLQVAECLAARGLHLYPGPIFRRLTELDPNCIEAWVGCGRGTLDAQEAAKYFEKALQLDPNHAEAQQGLSSARARLGGQAQDMIDEAQRLTLTGATEQAHALFRQAVQMDPDNVRGWIGCARTSADTKKSLEYVRRALKVDPHDTEARELFGWLWVPPSEPAQAGPRRSRWGVLLLLLVVLLIVLVAVLLLTQLRGG